MKILADIDTDSNEVTVQTEPEDISAVSQVIIVKAMQNAIQEMHDEFVKPNSEVVH